MAELVMIFDTVTGGVVIKQAAAVHIADAAVVSGKLGAGAVLSGTIASGQVGTPHVAAAAITSSLVNANALATPHFANQGILSASIGAAAVGTPHVANQAITSALVAAVALATPHFANQGILSASIGASVLATPHIANQGILSASIGAAVLATAHMANQGILSASIGAEAIGDAHVATNAITSGKVASGAITEDRLASGISIDVSETVQEPSYRAVSSGMAAYDAALFTLSGYFDWARAAQSGRAPAVGLTLAAVTLSGANVALATWGRITNTGWNFSGQEGRVVFLGTSSEVTVTAPSASGNYVQRVGKVIAPRTVFLVPENQYVQVGQ